MSVTFLLTIIPRVSVTFLPTIVPLKPNISTMEEALKIPFLLTIVPREHVEVA